APAGPPARPGRPLLAGDGLLGPGATGSAGLRPARPAPRRRSGRSRPRRVARGRSARRPGDLAVVGRRRLDRPFGPDAGRRAHHPRDGRARLRGGRDPGRGRGPPGRRRLRLRALPPGLSPQLIPETKKGGPRAAFPSSVLSVGPQASGAGFVAWVAGASTAGASAGAEPASVAAAPSAAGASPSPSAGAAAPGWRAGSGAGMA